jgi:F-type H+-transporting ATPase subunit b
MRAPAFWSAAGVGVLLAASLVTAQESPGKAASHEATSHEATSHEATSHEATSHEATKSEAASEGPSPIWAWANFAILAGALGYLIVKKGGPWFRSRSLAIRKGIAEAEEIRRGAEASAAEVDRRLAGLQTEIEKLRANAHREQSAEAERIRQQSAADLARIQEHGAREIDSAGKAARLELKRYAAQLAIDLAEQKIRRQMTPEVQAALIEGFGQDLDRSSAGPHPNKQ